MADHGPGAPPAERQRMFDAFVPLEDEATHTTQGTGPGLALVARLAASLGGTASAYETPGGGLTVRVDLRIS